MTLDPPDEAVLDDDENGDVAAETPAAKPKPKSKGGGSTTVLAAAMLAVGEILEPDKTTVEVEQTNDDPIDDLPFNIDFGDLPPLD